MLKMITCIKKLPELSLADFYSHWHSPHAALIRKHADVLGIRHYVQNAPYGDGSAQKALEFGRSAPSFGFDGCAELWWDDLESHLSARKTCAGKKALQEIIEDEKRFVDLESSLLWYCSERPILQTGTAF
ncbi:EthD domain-containing protein [Breoghania sp.]|uniref:EthD domain-containing protein n=1 Tax=Breoghania sp. TaxID=2065378 RepID=UPI002AA6F8E7|nr:EthD domain-containing protein [Breoghania sp.]